MLIMKKAQEKESGILCESVEAQCRPYKKSMPKAKQ